MMDAEQRGQPPHTRTGMGSEWPFLVFVIAIFVVIVLRSLLG
jgi:hypothetical protein